MEESVYGDPAATDPAAERGAGRPAMGHTAVARPVVRSVSTVTAAHTAAIVGGRGTDTLRASRSVERSGGTRTGSTSDARVLLAPGRSDD